MVGRGAIAAVREAAGRGEPVKAGGGEQGPILASPFSEDPAEMLTYLTSLMDNCSITDAETIPGRISINEAPAEILLGIPNISEETVQQIVDQREILAEDLSTRGHETWLLAEGIVDLATMKNLLPFICAGGDVFRAQVVGYYQGGGPSAPIRGGI